MPASGSDGRESSLPSWAMEARPGFVGSTFTTQTWLLASEALKVSKPLVGNVKLSPITAWEHGGYYIVFAISLGVVVCGHRRQKVQGGSELNGHCWLHLRKRPSTIVMFSVWLLGEWGLELSTRLTQLPVRLGPNRMHVVSCGDMGGPSEPHTGLDAHA